MKNVKHTAILAWIKLESPAMHKFLMDVKREFPGKNLITKFRKL